MVIGGDHGQEKFRNVCKYIMRNKDGKNMTSYVIKNGHIDHKKDTYEIFQHTLATPLNNDLEYLRRKDYCLYFKWKEDGKLEVSYEEKDNDSLSNYVSHVSIPLRILISGDLAFFATVVGKKICLESGVIGASYLQLNGKIVITRKVICGQYN